MANLLQIQNKSQLLYDKAYSILQEMRKEYEEGKIQTEVEYLHRIYSTFQDFYYSIGKPTMTVRKAWGPPSSDDYNQMLHEIYNDIATLYLENEHLAKALEESFRQIEVDRLNLNHQVERLEEKVSQIETKMTREPEEVIYYDSFMDHTTYDQEAVEDSLAHVWTSEGLLTLQPIAAEQYTSGLTVRITEGNGLPGNTKQVRVMNGELKFIGEENLHINLADTLDNNSDTWFEYETFELSDRVLEDTEGLGFEYYEGVKWVSEPDTTLRMMIEIELPAQKSVNWFRLSPFIPNDKGATSAWITSIEIHDGHGRVYSALTEPVTFHEEKAFMFGQQRCKRIVVKFEQPSAYETSVGHLFYKELEDSSVSFLEANRLQRGKRVNGIYPKIEHIGLQYDAAKKEIVQPSSLQGEETKGVNKKKEALFALPKINPMPANLQMGFEEVTAWRKVIGVRDMGLSNYQFRSSGEYRSIPFTSDQEILAVSLTADVLIPKEFPEGEWVEFFISIDEGQSWHRIYPRGTTEEGAKVMYLFNTNLPKEGRIDHFGYIDTTSPITEVRVKATLSRPTDIPDALYYTPIISEYKLYTVERGEA